MNECEHDALLYVNITFVPGLQSSRSALTVWSSAAQAQPRFCTMCWFFSSKPFSSVTCLTPGMEKGRSSMRCDTYSLTEQRSRGWRVGQQMADRREAQLILKTDWKSHRPTTGSGRHVAILSFVASLVNVLYVYFRWPRVSVSPHFIFLAIVINHPINKQSCPADPLGLCLVRGEPPMTMCSLLRWYYHLTNMRVEWQGTNVGL